MNASAGQGGQFVAQPSDLRRRELGSAIQACKELARMRRKGQDRWRKRETISGVADLGNHGLMPKVYPVKVTD
jgi:hypothetical protein